MQTTQLFYKAINLANLYAQIGNYDKAIELLHNTITKSKQTGIYFF